MNTQKDTQSKLLIVMIAMLIVLSFVNVVFLVTKMVSDYKHEQKVENVCKEALKKLNEWENTYEIIEVAE